MTYEWTPDGFKKDNTLRNIGIILLLLVIGWPGPVLYSHLKVNHWANSCSHSWAENAQTFSQIDIRQGAYSYYENGKSFTQLWVANEGTKGTELYCFGNLWQEHFQAIKTFDAQLDEYKRQLDLGASLSPPVLPESFYKYTKVEYLCQAPSLLGLQLQVSCQTFLNVI